MKKYTLKSNSLGLVKLPAEIWQEAGWKLNDEVDIFVSKMYNSKDQSWSYISIERVKDLERYDEDYKEHLESDNDNV
tara:strand:+ start:5291 stop:5521 length:231 start_codon:yes stop_codon:yes gene_type:complete